MMKSNPKMGWECGGKVIETPHGTLTLEPITEEDMERMKKALLSDPELDLDLCDPVPDPVPSLPGGK